VFGRTKTPTQAPVSDAAETLKADGKGRPTPKRREAELANRTPLIGNTASAKAVNALAQAKTKDERKAAKAAQRDAARGDRARVRQALISGDEAHLPMRDRGPVRRYARDFVDSRRWAGEYVLPVALVVAFLSIVTPKYSLITFGLLYLMIIIVIFDSGRLRGKLKREQVAKFGDKAQKSDATYGMMRSLTWRRLRMPKPQVERGQHPS